MRTISSSSFSSPSSTKQSWVSLQSPSEDSVDTWMVALMLFVTCLVQLYMLFLYLESFPSSHGWAPSHPSDLGSKCSLLGEAFPDHHT